jgi:cation transport protein ChaC
MINGNRLQPKMMAWELQSGYQSMCQGHGSQWAMLEVTLDAIKAQHPPGEDLWVFAYASLIWRQEFTHTEQHLTHVHGWHRALKMWSRINRGTPESPGLVFALLPGGSCKGLVFRIPAKHALPMLDRLWLREMPNHVYTPKYLDCPIALGTANNTVRALTFTLPKTSPSYTGHLSAAQYRAIFSKACGRFGSTLDYAQQTLASLQKLGIEDRALQALLKHAP